MIFNCIEVLYIYGWNEMNFSEIGIDWYNGWGNSSNKCISNSFGAIYDFEIVHSTESVDYRF